MINKEIQDALLSTIALTQSLSQTMSLTVW